MVTRVLVVGDLILDRTVNVSVRGVSPENCNILVCDQKTVTDGLGGAGNVAANIDSLGVPVTVFSAGHVDEAGSRLRELLEERHIEHWIGGYHGGETSVKTRFTSSSGQLLRVDNERDGILSRDMWAQATVPGAQLSALAAAIPSPILCLVDYNKGLFAGDTTHLMHWSRVNSITTLVDPGRRGKWERFSSPATIFKINSHQALQYVGDDWHGPTFGRARGFDSNELYPTYMYQALLSRTREKMIREHLLFSHLIVTFGAGGMGLATCNGRIELYQPRPCNVIDVTGAGDTVLAALATHLAEHHPNDVEAACFFAVRAARVAVQKRGCYAVTKLDIALDTHP